MLNDKLSFFSKRIQYELFPILEEELTDELLDSHRKVASYLEVIQIERVISKNPKYARGRPQSNIYAIARALLAKQILNIPTIANLIDRLKCDKNLRYICGWSPYERVQSESTFSRFFSYLSETGILDELHRKLVADVYENHLVIHCARDSMPVEVRERPEKDYKEKKIKNRYPYKGKNNKKLTLCEYQNNEATSLQEMVAPLNKNCDIGKKTNGYGMSKCWRGYKLHMDVADGFFPISCELTAASTHDSQVAIPLSKKSSERTNVLYELMDSAYDSNEIIEYIEKNDRKPLVRMHKRKGKRKEFVEENEKSYQTLNWVPADEERLKTRFSNERLFARLGDSFLGKSIFVRGHKKVFCQVMLGILSLCASEVLRFNL